MRGSATGWRRKRRLMSCHWESDPRSLSGESERGRGGDGETSDAPFLRLALELGLLIARLLFYDPLLWRIDHSHKLTNYVFIGFVEAAKIRFREVLVAHSKF